jgi:hypothetical protein
MAINGSYFRGQFAISQNRERDAEDANLYQS